MILLNFSHPITSAQKRKIQELTQQNITQVIEIPVQMDNALPYAEQIRQLVNKIPLDAVQWQTESILVNPPAYNFAALTLFAELHGRTGYFPAIIRVRPLDNSVPKVFEVREILDLQMIRERARKLR